MSEAKKAKLAPATHTAKIFWSKVHDKNSWNVQSGKFDGPPKSVVTVGMEVLGEFEGKPAKAVIFEDLRNYITPPKDGKSGSKLYSLLAAVYGSQKVSSLSVESARPEGEKSTAFVEGLGQIKGVTVTVLTGETDKGRTTVVNFSPKLPVSVATFSGWDYSDGKQTAMPLPTPATAGKPQEVLPAKVDDDDIPF